MTIPKLQLLCLANIKLQTKKRCEKLESYLPPVLKKISDSISFYDFKKCRSDVKRLSLKLLLQREFPATCAGGFAAFCLKDTKKFQDIDIFCFVDITKDFLSSQSFLFYRRRFQVVKNVKNMIERKITECKIFAKVRYFYHHPDYPHTFCIVFRIACRRGKIDFVCLFSSNSLEVKDKCEQNSLFRAKNICEGFDLKICQVSFIHLCAQKFIVFRLSKDVPAVPSKKYYSNIFGVMRKNKFLDHFINKNYCWFSWVRLEKYFNRVQSSYNRHSPESLALTQNFIRNCLNEF